MSRQPVAKLIHSMVEPFHARYDPNNMEVDLHKNTQDCGRSRKKKRSFQSTKQHNKMPTTRRTTTRRSGGLMSKLTGRGRRTTTTTTTTTTSGFGRSHGAAPVHHHRRKASMGDKVSGAMMKLRGSLTRRPGLKVCDDAPSLPLPLSPSCV